MIFIWLTMVSPVVLMVCVSVSVVEFHGGGSSTNDGAIASSLAYNAMKGVTLPPWHGQEALLPKGMCATIF